MTDLKISIYHNFIEDLAGINIRTNIDQDTETTITETKRINSIYGFYVLGIKKSDNSIFYTGKASFVNLDNKSEQLLTNLYTGNSDSLAQGSDIGKLVYLYEVIYDGESLIDNQRTDLSVFKSEQWIQNQGSKTLNQFIEEKEKPSYLRIAFEIINDNNNLTALSVYEAFRPRIDLHKFKIFVNLVSTVQSVNELFHAHDTFVKSDPEENTIQTINYLMSNSATYKNYGATSLLTFKSEFDQFNYTNTTQVCYEDWNLLNLKPKTNTSQN